MNLEKKYNILLLAYACLPNTGSEPGVGWNSAIESSKFNNIYVLTHASNKNKIEQECEKFNLSNIQFFYYCLPKSLSFIDKFFGMRFEYFFWNIFSFNYLKKLDKQYNFDLIHHISFIQYRTISFGFFSRKPFVFGPIGGAELIKFTFFKDLQFSTLLKEFYRKSKIDVWFFNLLFKVNTNKKVVVYSSYENSNNLNFNSKNILESIIYPSIGFSMNDFTNSNSRINNDNFNMVYAGRAEDWKGLQFLFKVLGGIQIYNVQLKLIGIRKLEERLKIENWIKKYNLNIKIEIIDFIPRSDLLNLIKNSDLFLYPAFRDSGSMAILEASVVGCPTLCLKVGGQDLLPNDSVIMVEPCNSYEKTIEIFTNRLEWAINNKDELNNIGLRAQKFAFENYQWSERVIFFNKIYKKLLE